MRSVFELLEQGGTVGGVSVRAALELIEAPGTRHVELTPTYRLFRPVEDFVAGPTADRGTSTPTAYVSGKLSTKATTTWHLRIVNPKARSKLAPLLHDIQAGAPTSSDEVELNPAAAAVIRALGKRLRRGKPKQEMMMPTVAGYRDTKYAFGQYAYPRPLWADELVAFVKAYPGLFKSTAKGEPVPANAGIVMEPA